jgi:erythromycin esterase
MPAPLRSLLAACLLLAACDSPAGSGATPPDTPLDWVEQNAHVVRSIDVGDRDWSDLEPLRRAIGDARVVMLGEQSHGDGTTFLAKARLVAFLHQEMGFDVLIWESGMYDVDRVWQQILAGEDVFAASRRGIFDVWSLSEQVRPTLEYVRSTLGTPRPLEMAGFDMQLTTRPESDSLDIQLARFAAEISSPVLNDPRWPTARAALRQLASGDRTSPPPAQTQIETMAMMGDLFDDAVAEGGRRALWWAEVLRSTAVFAARVWRNPGIIEGAVMRENAMSRNLAWLAREHYRGRKVIVWAASLHISRNLEELRTPEGSPVPSLTAVKPMGGQVVEALGAGEVYTIGFTAARGSFGRGGTRTPLQPPLAESLEAHLDQLGMAYAFIDLRNPAAGGEWLTHSLMRPFGYSWFRGDWTEVLDGMFYTREMTTSDLRS